MITTPSGIPKNPFSVLSTRERDVLQLVTRDLTDREIARQLKIRERTVRAHVSRIILKLGVASRVGAAVAFATWTLRLETGEYGDSGMVEEPMDESRVHTSC